MTEDVEEDENDGERREDDEEGYEEKLPKLAAVVRRSKNEIIRKI